ncbi:MAG: T9SS type A sorting domain-containing protein [Candidatus Cloacimonetes bacterium]|nr:T9SS type A sorting domain-containing protein [Candidatus Cloacimonadota bacterium]
MKYASLFLMLCMLSSLVAQEFDWDDNGIPVVQGANIRWGAQAVRTTDGGIVCVWTNTSAGNRRVVAKKLMPDGSEPWGEEPVYVCDSEGTQERPVVTAVVDGCVVIVWTDYTSDPLGDIHAQRLSQSGERLWDEEGIVVCDMDTKPGNIALVPANDSQVHVFWVDGDLHGVFRNRITNNGFCYCGHTGAIVAGSIDEDSHLSACSDGFSGAILTCRLDNDDEDDLLAIRVGSTNWIVPLCVAPGEQMESRVCRISNGVFGFVWRDERENNDGDIYAQACDIDGNLLWAADVIVNAGDFEHKNPHIINDGDGGMFIAWLMRQTNPYSSTYFYVQKIDSDGNLLWDTEGVILCDESIHYGNHGLAAGDNGDVYAVWGSWQGYYESQIDVFMQHVLSDGSIAWEENGRAVCTLPGRQRLPFMARSGNFLLLAWADDWLPEESRDPYPTEPNAACLRTQVLTLDGAELLAPDGQVFAEGPILYDFDPLELDLQIVPCGESTYVLWMMSTRYTMQLHAQKLLPDGSTAWGETGVVLADFGSGIPYDYTATLHHDGGLAYTWSHKVGTQHRVFANACDNDGNRLWGEEGVAVSELPRGQYEPNIERWDEEYVVGWIQTEPDSLWGSYRNVYAQKIVDGTIQWGSDGIQVFTENDYYTHLRDIVGPYFLIEIGYKTYVVRLESDGTISPGFETLLAIGATDDRQNYPSGEMVGNDLLVVYENCHNYNRDIYGQLVHPDGSVAWGEDGAPLIVGPWSQLRPLLAVHEDGGVVSCQAYPDELQMVRLQNFDMNGAVQWDPMGLLISTDEGRQCLSAMGVNDDGVLIAWRDYLGNPSDLRLQLVNMEGELLYEEGGVILCDAPYYQHDPLMAPAGDDHVVLVWNDQRAARQYNDHVCAIYAQRVNTSVTGVNDPVPAPPALRLAQNTPNPFNPETAIDFSLAAPSHITLCVYNIRGQLVNTLVNDRLPAGTHSVVWDGRDSHGVAAGSGIYLYQLRSGSHTATRRMLLLK